MKTDYDDSITLKKHPDFLVIIPFFYEIGFVYLLIIISYNNVFCYDTADSFNVSIESLPYLLIFLIYATPFIFFLFLCIDIQCWNFMGKEKIIFHEEFLSISQKGRTLKYNRKINYKDIVSIEFERYPRGPLGIDLFYTYGWKGGCIKITKNDGNSYYFGQSLTAPEAKRNVIPKIKEIILEKSGIQL